MSRLQKKCFIVSAATHGSLILLLLVGPAFFVPQSKPDTFNFITLVGEPTDAATRGGRTPSPQAVESAPQAPPSQPNQPLSAPQPPPAHSDPAPVRPTPVAAPETAPRNTQPKPDDFKPAKKNEPVKKNADQGDDFKPVVRAPNTKPQNNQNQRSNTTQVADNDARLANGLQTSLKNLKRSIGNGAAVQVPSPGGDSGDAVSNYRDLVGSVYTAAWNPPASLDDDSATVTVSVTIARDGHVTHHELTKRSGNAAMDRSIEAALDSVTFVEEFPANSRDLARTFAIKFNLAAKRSLG